MAFDLHTVSLLSGGSPLAYTDRLLLGLLNQVAYDAGNGAVSAIAAGTAGVGYATIPTVALTPPTSGAKSTGTGATATAVMKAITATVVAGGTGGTPGAVTITGTTGTGTKFQATGTINGSGVLTGALIVTVGGAYTAMPTSLAAEPVTGGSLSGCTVALSMGVASYTVGAGGSNYPVTGVTAAVSGGSPTTAAVPGAVTVTTAAGAIVAFDVTAYRLPAAYNVQVTVDQDAVAFVSTRTQTGFRVTVSPRLAASSLAAGALDIKVTA